MNPEYEIRRIMRCQKSISQKAEMICKMVSWDKKKLIKSMEKYGTFGSTNRSSIILEFWPYSKNSYRIADNFTGF